MVLLASSYDQSKFFRAADLPQPKKLKIKSYSEETVGQGSNQEKKLCLWFTNDKRGLLLNKTNNRAMRGKFDDPVDGWVGKIITLFSTPVPVGAKLERAIRIRFDDGTSSADKEMSADNWRPPASVAAATQSVVNGKEKSQAKAKPAPQPEPPLEEDSGPVPEPPEFDDNIDF
jgi:hypothetical protein